MSGVGPPARKPYKPRQHPRAPVSYTYTRLSEAIQTVGTGKVVNIYAVVTDFEQPRKTSGTDNIATLTVVDMSYSTPGMRLLFFAKDMDLLPRVAAPGDVIRIHRLELKEWGSTVQGHAKVGKNAHYLLFDGQPDGPTEPYAQSSPNFTWEEQDMGFLRTLRRWGATHPLDPDGLRNKGHQYMRTIASMEDEEHIDVYAKVLWVEERGEGGAHRLTLHVWDGTDARPDYIPESPDDETDPYLLPPSQPPPSVLASLPPLGTALPIVTDDNVPLAALSLMPVAGKWYKFRNIKVVREKGSLRGYWGKSTKVMALGEGERHVQERLRHYAERVNGPERITDEVAWVQQRYSVTDHDDVPFSTLREVLATPAEVRNSRFRCIVRVRSSWPPRTEDLCVSMTSLDDALRAAVEADLERGVCGEAPGDSPRNPEGVSGPEGTSRKRRRREEWVFRATLTLEDPTARLSAELFGRDAETFFGGWSPRNSHQEDDGVDELRWKMGLALGQATAPEDGDNEEPQQPRVRDPPWLVCCIQSYVPDDPSSGGLRCYRIFDTKLAA
ncbi:protection of telomeres 1 protein [Klebsormidium nitens]|uniref:Protection of telomeres 1 protein n=1 Tax=Klebsormidium nitens TaxID=105231 RepID=A0A1Y1HR73_KLENI|nr:protection of telomeres 1 protein [Klebsormidium nitens]|eukprot:GAQ79481.1 protection of telomeres 1 protein [Klebsormidium nitens]